MTVSSSTEAPPLLRVRGLEKHFPVMGGFPRRVLRALRAVDGISFDLGRGETLSLVGESGCGKSTTGRTILRLLEPTAGTVEFEGRDVTAMSKDALREFRRQVQIVFQDPFSSLNPRMTIGAILDEALKVHGLAGDASGRLARVKELLERVGLAPEYRTRYPHEFSGGQRQRVGIARALSVEPSLIICDEPVSALDVSIQAQVINLLQDLQSEFGLSYLFIAHDLAVVRQVSHRVAVMYLGRIVEEAPTDTLFSTPFHPYTQALLSAVPSAASIENRRPDRIRIPGDVPDGLIDSHGCRFFPRCPHPLKDSTCEAEDPLLVFTEKDHGVACLKGPCPLWNNSMTGT